ncbi:unnamed protein product [Symbiodinium sp. CCMP2592]|nr:unnamed protein product [Symbiodinium sp. CCMP2592]
MANLVRQFLCDETRIYEEMSWVIGCIEDLEGSLTNSRLTKALLLEISSLLRQSRDLPIERISQMIFACEVLRRMDLEELDDGDEEYWDGQAVCIVQLRCAVRLAVYARDVSGLLHQILPDTCPQSLPSVPTEDAQPLRNDADQQFEEVVEHDEPPAFRDPELLREQEEHDWADRVVDRILSPPCFEEDAGNEEQHEAVWMLPFKRTPKEFTEALLHGPELQAVREEMAQHGCPVVLAHGAKIFVRPHQYHEVLQELELHGASLKASHVIIMDSLKTSLEEIIGRLPSKLKCKVNEAAVECVKTASFHRPHNSHHEGGEDWIQVEELLAVEKTFLCKVRRFKRLNEVSQSTRDSRKGTNPRRYELSSDFS